MAYQEKVIKLMDKKREMFDDYRYFTLEDRLNVYRIPEWICEKFWNGMKRDFDYHGADPNTGSSCVFCFVYNDEDNDDSCQNCPYEILHGNCNVGVNSLWEYLYEKYDGKKVMSIIKEIENENS